MSLAQTIKNTLAKQRARHGAQLLLNGQTVYATFSAATNTTIQNYLAEEYWAQTVYQVAFSPDHLDAPYNLKDGAGVAWVTLGWTGVVRRLLPNGPGERSSTIPALVVLTAR